MLTIIHKFINKGDKAMKNKNRIVASIVMLVIAAICFPCIIYQANAETAHLKPDPVCVPVGVELQLGLTGAKFKGAGVWTDNKDIVSASESGVIKGKKVGETRVHIGGAAEKVSWGDTHVKVKSSWAECAATFKADNPPKVVDASATTPFRFAFMSDPQGDSADIINKKTVNHEFAKWFAKQMATEEKPRFILVGGDLANYGGDADLWIDDTVGNLKTSDGKSVVGSMPIYSTVGNHDLVDNALGYYKESMQNDWNDLWQKHYVKKGGAAWPTTGPEDLSKKGLAYAFVYANSLFIVIDSYYMWGNAEFHKATSDHGMLEEIDAKQLAWVAWLSNWAKRNTATIKHIFLLTHPPLLTTDRPNNTQLKKIMAENAMFDALLCGHSHSLHLDLITLKKGSSVYQLINGTAAGSAKDRSYLRVEVDGAKVTVTAVHKTDKGAVPKESVNWTK
jgi:hypothetical protein